MPFVTTEELHSNTLMVFVEGKDFPKGVQEFNTSNKIKKKIFKFIETFVSTSIASSIINWTYHFFVASSSPPAATQTFAVFLQTVLPIFISSLVLPLT